MYLITDPDNLPDLKLHLQGTDYGPLLANDPSPLIVQTIDERLKERLVHEFTHIRNQCLQPLAQFLDYMTYGLVYALVSTLIARHILYSPLPHTSQLTQTPSF